MWIVNYIKRFFIKKRLAGIFSNFLSMLGVLWFIVECFTYFLKIDVTLSLFIFCCVVLIIISIAKNRPITVKKCKLRGVDSTLSIRIGDIFQGTERVVIGVNNKLDVGLNGKTMQAQSVMRHLIDKYYSGKAETLQEKLSIHQHNDIKIGQVYVINKDIEDRSITFYFVVNTEMNETTLHDGSVNKVVTGTILDFDNAIQGLFSYIKDLPKPSKVSIPLLNSQHSRTQGLTSENVCKKIIEEFVRHSQESCIVSELEIVIHPNNIMSNKIDIDELFDYLEFYCYRYLALVYPKHVDTEVELK